MPINHILDEMAALREAIVREDGPDVVYNDGGGDWVTRCLSSRERRFILTEEGELLPDPLWPGGTTLEVTANEGTRFSFHKHFSDHGDTCWEVFTVKGGILEVTVEGCDPVMLYPGGGVYAVEPGKRHSMFAKTDVLFDCTTIPTAGGFTTHDARSEQCTAGVSGEDGAGAGGTEPRHDHPQV